MENLLSLLNDYKEHRMHRCCAFCGANLKHNNASRAYNDYCMSKTHFFKYDKKNNNLAIHFMERDHGLRIVVKSDGIKVFSSHSSMISNSEYLSNLPVQEVEGYINELLDNYKILE